MGNLSQSQLAVKFGLAKHDIRNWKKLFSNDIACLQTKEQIVMTAQELQEQEGLKQQLVALKKEVEYLKMKELALETMIDIAKEEFDIDLRKKSGTKPSDE